MAPSKAKKVQAKPLMEVLANSIRYHRERIGWTQDELAEQMTLLGFSWNRVTVAEVEGRGRGRKVAVEEVLALAMIFGVGVGHLLTSDEAETRVTAKLTLSQSQLQAVMTIGYGQAGPPELRRMQLEFRRERARAYLEMQQEQQSDLLTNLAAARRDLEQLDQELSELDTTHTEEDQ